VNGARQKENLRVRKTKLTSLSQPWQIKMKMHEVLKKWPDHGVRLWVLMYPKKSSSFLVQILWDK
jgi:hypothetical protein